MTPSLRCFEFADGCANLVDIYYPENPGPWPVIVTIHGRPRTPADMAPIARDLARRGAVVYNADYRGVRPVTKGFPESINDVSCAVRFARATASAYGGDGEHLVLVGHSQGGYVGSLVSLSGDEFVGPAGTCLADEDGVVDRQASLPDGFVQVAGVSIVYDDLRLDWIYFGGSPAEKPDACDAGRSSTISVVIPSSWWASSSSVETRSSTIATPHDSMALCATRATTSGFASWTRGTPTSTSWRWRAWASGWCAWWTT